MSEYEEFDELEKEKITKVIKTLLAQTYLLEHKYDRKQRHMIINPEFRICDQHFSFLKAYFAMAGLKLMEDIGNGVFYLSGGEGGMGSKLLEYTTKFILILKVIYEEQMSLASTINFVVTSRADVQEKMDAFHLMNRQPTSNDVRTTFRLLKKYQILDLMDMGDETELNARFCIYPTIQMLLFGEDMKELISLYCEEGGETDGAKV